MLRLTFYNLIKYFEFQIKMDNIDNLGTEKENDYISSENMNRDSSPIKLTPVNDNILKPIRREPFQELSNKHFNQDNEKVSLFNHNIFIFLKTSKLQTYILSVP